MSTTSLTRLMLAPGFAQTQSAGEKSWWPRPERHRCVCSEETRRQPSPSGSYRRTVLTAATESSARPSCRIVTVVGPPPSAEATADERVDVPVLPEPQPEKRRLAKKRKASGCSRSRIRRRLPALLRLPRPGTSGHIHKKPRRSGC